MENNKTWILIADASKAKLYTIYKARIFQDQQNTKNLELIGQFTHTDSRKKKAELVADRKGEFGFSTFGDATSPKAREAEQFAQELLTHLATGHTEKTYQDLIIVAPPTFMGIINKHIPKEINKLICKTIEKDYTQLEDKELLQSLMNHL